MKVLVTGASGMVGKGVLIECLEDERVTEVTSLGRRSIDLKHPKLKEVLHADFSEFESISDQLKGVDASFACMGVSSVGMKEEEYSKLTYEYTLALAKTMYNNNAESTFSYVSGMGTDSTEKGRSMWARVKGKTENHIIALGFKGAYMYRPGMIVPKKGVLPKSKVYLFFIKYMSWLIHLTAKVLPKSVVQSDEIGKAMINVHLMGYPKSILNPVDIQLAAKR